ncbi:cell division protein FtsA [Zhaonella formicivorans]|uniref:cell division protein FtsA n=1 Tax=Zhaonella formicivorans TaxID=2528593 RepID=UPI003BF5338E
MQKLPKKNVIVGLDIGTSKVVAVVGEIGEEGQVNVIGVGECASVGLRKGTIVDIENTAKSVEKAVEKAEQMSGVNIDSAFVGITGPHIASLNNRGVVAVASHDREISAEDATRVLQAAKVIALPADRKIIHVLPRQYIVDGYDGIVDPVGMSGSRLEVETNIVTGAGTSIQNTIKSVTRAGIQVEALVFNALASAEAALVPAEKELGALLVDIGGGTTELALYEQGSLWFASVIPIGGDHVTSDLAVGLRTPIMEAEKIKKKYGCVLQALMPDDDYIEVPNVGGNEVRRVSRKLLASIIEPRMQEIFSLVKSELKRCGYKGVLPGGVVLTGGSALMDGLVQLAGSEMNMPVRVGMPCNVGGMADIVNSPAYATALGILTYGSRNVAFLQAAPTADPLFGGLLSRFFSWFKEIF